MNRSALQPLCLSKSYLSKLSQLFSRAPHLLTLLSLLTVSLLSIRTVSASPAPPQNGARTNATFQATLTDPSGSPVSGAAINLEPSPATANSSAAPPANSFQAISSPDGHFRLEVPPGRYRLTITRPSLQRYESEISLAAGETRDLSVQLLIEPLSSTVVVSAEAQPISTTAASEPVDILTRQDIDQRQAIEVAPLLQTLPGVNFAQTGPEGGIVSLFMDGGKSNYTKVLMDGVPMNDPGGAMDFSNITLDNVDKVEVVHGAQSALAGSDAMAGTISILSHRGSTQTPEVVVESEGGSFDTGRGMAQISGLAGRFDYSVAGAFLQTNGQGPNDMFVNRTISGNFGFRVAKNDTLRLTIRNISSFAGEPGQTLLEPPALGQTNVLHNLSAGLTWNFSTGTHWQHQVFVSETDIHEQYQDYLNNFPTFSDSPYFDVNQYNRVDAQAQTSYVAKPGTITAGYWYEVENGFPDDLDGEHARRNNQAGFLDGRWLATGRLVLNAGVRIENNSSFGTRAVPRVGAAYTLRYGHDLVGATRLRFIYGQGIKEPAFDQSFGTDPCFPGNPNLKPEQNQTINAGIEQELDRSRVLVSADYFDNDYHDIVSFASSAATSGCPFGLGTYFNTDLARARGSHLRFQTKIARNVNFSGNYTYDDSRVLVAPNASDPTETAGNRLFLQPVNSGNLILNGGVGRFQGNLEAIFVGERTDSDFLGLGYTSVPGYARLDVAISGRISRNLSLIARVQNLLDNHYQDALGYPALGVAAYGGIRLRLGGNE
jgi:vitamin B12 transporter